MMKCLIADDNELALITLKNLLSQIPGIELVAVCRDAMEVYEYLKGNSADLAILDVEMPGMSGLELIRTLTHKPAIILSTANPEYAADAFDLDVADFIVKPVSLPRLLKSISKINALLRQDARYENQQLPVPGYIFIKEKGALKKINLQEVLYVEAMGDYVKIHFEDKWHTANTTIKELEEKYSSIFIRCHRSYLVSLQKIDTVDEGMVHLRKIKLPLADTYRKKLIEKIKPI